MKFQNLSVCHLSSISYEIESSGKNGDAIFCSNETGSIIIVFLILGRNQVCMRILVFRFIYGSAWKLFIKAQLTHTYKENRRYLN